MKLKLTLIMLASMLTNQQLFSSAVSTQIINTSTSSPEALVLELNQAIESLNVERVRQYIEAKKPVNKAQALAHVDALFEKYKYRKLSWANAGSAAILACGAGAIIYTSKQLHKQKKLLPQFTFKTGFQLLWRPVARIAATAVGQPALFNRPLNHIEQSLDNLGQSIGITLLGAVCLGGVYAEAKKKETKLVEIKKLLENYMAENNTAAAATTAAA